MIGASAVEAIYARDLGTGEEIPGGPFEGGERSRRLAYGVSALTGSAAAATWGVAKFTPLGPKMFPKPPAAGPAPAERPALETPAPAAPPEPPAAEAAASKLPTKPPLVGGKPPQNPQSQPFTPGLEPGTYVYVQAADGTIYVAPNAPGAHPSVLGGGQPAAAAGELTIAPGGVITEVNNISYTFQFTAEVLPQVAETLRQAGATVAPGAIRPFVH